MKKIITILMLMTIGLSAQAQELTVNGKDISLSKDGTYLDATGLITFRYLYQEKKLVFTNNVLTRIVSSVEDLTIEFYGTNTIMHTGQSAAVQLNNKTKLINNGTVAIRGRLQTGDEADYRSLAIYNSTHVDISGGTWNLKGEIRLQKSNSSTDPYLTIKDGAVVNVTTNLVHQTGISGFIENETNHLYGYTGVVEVDNSTLEVETDQGDCIDARVVLKNSVIAKPLKVVHGDDGSVYDGEQGIYGELYDTKRNRLTGSVLITPGTAYDLWIGGVRVNSENINDIYLLDSRPNRIGLSYNPSTKSLNLYESVLNSEYLIFPPIYSKVDGLFINVAGTCNIGKSENSCWVGIYSRAKCTICGMGTVQDVLNVKGYKINNNYGDAIHVDENTTLNIWNLTVNAQGNRYGLYGYKCTVSPYNSYITLDGDSYALSASESVFDPDGECAIVKPVGGIRRGATIYEADGVTKAKHVELVPRSSIITGLEQVEGAADEQSEPLTVYSTSGQLLWQGKGDPQLPRGIYIVNGRKVAVR